MNKLSARTNRQALTLDQLMDQMLEFGIPMEAIERVAPALLPLLNDPRGIRIALVEDSPRFASEIGFGRLQ
jgi:hypothetical protein